jgi:hypothetical protein
LCIILSPYEIINITHSDAIAEITPTDIILIQNLIFSSESLRLTESWIPICLPGISDAGYLQLYCNFYEKELAIVYITQYQDHSYFLEFVEQSRRIYERFQNEKIYESISSAIEHRDKSVFGGVRQIPDINEDKMIEQLITCNMNIKKRKTITKRDQQVDQFEEAKFLVCKQKLTNQIFTFRFNNYDQMTEEECCILKVYSKLYDIYKQNNTNNFSYFQKSDKYINCIVANDNFTLFSTFNFFKEYDEINDILAEIIKTIKANESYFFIKLKG